MNRTTLLTLGLLLTVVLLGSAVVWYVLERNAAAQLETTTAGQAFSATSSASYTNLAGEPLSLDEYLGKRVVVLSWASWCPSCADQIRTHELVAREQPDVAFLAINRAEPATTAERYLSYHQIPISSPLTIVLDARDHFYKTTGGYAAPETVIFDESGNIVHHLRGNISPETLRSSLSQY